MPIIASKLWEKKWKILLIGFAVWIVAEIAFLPFGDVVGLKKKNPTETAFMRNYAEKARIEKKTRKWKQEWIRLDEIPHHVRNAIIISEDGSFWWHNGFDWFELKESFKRNVMEFRVARGASTITQQLAKNLYLSPSKDPLRKLKEWILTFWLEKNLSKNRILEIYLNILEMGEGVYGVQSGSRYHFGKSVSMLSREEAARLATVIPNPKKYKANSTSRYIDRQSRIILKRMEARNL